MKTKLRLVKSNTAQGGVVGKNAVVTLVRRPKIVVTKP